MLTLWAHTKMSEARWQKIKWYVESEDDRAERPPTPSPPWSPCVCDRRRDVSETVAPGSPPLGHRSGLTPARASPPRGLTPHPGAAHAGSGLPTPGPHAPPWGGSRRRGRSPPPGLTPGLTPPTWGRLTGAIILTQNRGLCSRAVNL